MLLALTTASDDEVRKRSFGRVTRIVAAAPTCWQDATGTLFDPRIFGPTEDDRCACGALSGRPHRGSICATCGVRLGRAARLQRKRCGHIDLVTSIAHPWFPDCAMSALLVLPAAFRRAPLGSRDLDALYSDVVDANTRCAHEADSSSLARAVARLFCNEWLQEPRMHRNRCLTSLLWLLLRDAYDADDKTMMLLRALRVRLDATASPRWQE